MPYPNLEGKHAHDALVSPEDFVRYWVAQGRLPEEFTAPTGVVMLWQRRLYGSVLRRDDVSPFRPVADRGVVDTAFLGLHTFDATGGTVWVPNFAHPLLAERLGAMVPAAVAALVAMASG